MSVMTWIKEHPAESGGIAAGVALLALLVFSGHGGGGSSAAQLAAQNMNNQTQLQLASIQTAPALQQLQDQFALQSSEINAGLQAAKQQNQSNNDMALLGFIANQNQVQAQSSALTDYLAAQRQMAQLQADTATTINQQNIGAANQQLSVWQQLMAEYLPIQGNIAAMTLANQGASINAGTTLGLAQIGANQNIANLYAANQAAAISGSNTAGILGGIGNFLGGASKLLGFL